MAKYCGECGKELTEGAKVCATCGKAVPIESSLLNQKTVDEAKKKLASASSIVKEQSMKAAANLRDELKSINEARSKTLEEQGNGDDKGKLDRAKTLSASFWSKLSGKQRAILILGPVLLIAVFAKSLSSAGSEGSSDYSSNSDYRAHPGEVEELEAKFYSMGPRCPVSVKNVAARNMIKVRELYSSPFPAQRDAARNLAGETILYLASFHCISR